MGKGCLDRPQSHVIYTGIPSVVLPRCANCIFVMSELLLKYNLLVTSTIQKYLLLGMRLVIHNYLAMWYYS